MGIIEFSTGNMRTGFEFFEIDPYWSCKELGAPIQELAKAVYAAGRAGIAAVVGPS